MKRFLCFLVLFSLLYASALCDSDKGLYLGQWIHTEYNANGTLTFILIDLQEDGSAITVFGKADGDDSKVPGRSFLGSWVQTRDGITVISGHNTSKKLFLTDNDFLAEKLYGSHSLYSRIIPYETNDATDGPVSLSMLETGVQIPTGTYYIGEDIPAGTYRFDMNKTSAAVEYYETSNKILPSSDFTLDTRNKTYARLRLEEGGKLVIKNSSIILSYAKKLFE